MKIENTIHKQKNNDINYTNVSTTMTYIYTHKTIITIKMGKPTQIYDSLQTAMLFF